jgi:hypothetical protein
MLFGAYKRLLGAEGGPRYLHDGGKLDIAAFQTYMKDIAGFDLEYFEENRYVAAMPCRACGNVFVDG